MRKLIGVMTEDRVLYNKIRLLLRDGYTVERIGKGDATEQYALVLADVRLCVPDSPCLTVGEGCDVPLIFRHEELIELVEGASELTPEPLVLLGDGRQVSLFGERIRLTEVEYKLLEAILGSDGFVSKRELLLAVWGEGYDEGVVNVYVHYLRRKLEKSGNKIIISSRGGGYGIDEKYRRRG